MITKAGNQQVRVGNHRNPKRTSYALLTAVIRLYMTDEDLSSEYSEQGMYVG